MYELADYMTWLQRYRVRHYVANSIWILPLFGMVAALAAGRFLHWANLQGHTGPVWPCILKDVRYLLLTSCG